MYLVADNEKLTCIQLIWILFHHLNAQEEQMNALESDMEDVSQFCDSIVTLELS